MAATKSKYVYGAVAEKLNDNIAEKLNDNIYDPYEENPVLKAKKVARSNAKLKTKIIFNILIIFSLGALTMFKFAQISQINYETNKLNKQYVAIQNENRLLEIEIENARSLENIREVAEDKLQMHKPNKNQIVYISVPKEDVIVLASNEPSKAVTILKTVENSIKEFLSIFY